jgi:hypothetical protein
VRIALLRLRDPKDLATLQANLDTIENAFNKLLPAEAAQTAAASYVGDGTAGRSVAVGFMPRYVLVFDATGGATFEAIGSGLAALGAWYRVAAGTLTQDATQWQGIVAGGFQLGSAAACASNVSARTYAYLAQR